MPNGSRISHQADLVIGRSIHVASCIGGSARSSARSCGGLKGFPERGELCR